MQPASRPSARKHIRQEDRSRTESPSRYLMHLEDVRYVIDQLRSNRPRFLASTAHRRQVELRSCSWWSLTSSSTDKDDAAVQITPECTEDVTDHRVQCHPGTGGHQLSSEQEHGLESHQQPLLCPDRDEKSVQEGVVQCPSQGCSDAPTHISEPRGLQRSRRNLVPSATSMQPSTVTDRGDDLDTYLAELLVPFLHDGLVALCRTVELMMSDTDRRRLGNGYHNRFNPLCWLAQYLFRHNPTPRPRISKNSKCIGNENTELPDRLPGDRNVCFQRRVNCKYRPFYDLFKDIVNDERARRDFLLRKEEVRYVFDAFRHEKGCRQHNEGAARNLPHRPPQINDIAVEGEVGNRSGAGDRKGVGVVAPPPVPQNTASTTGEAEAARVVHQHGSAWEAVPQDGNETENLETRPYTPIAVDDIPDLLERLDRLWEMGGRMAELFEKSTLPLVPTGDFKLVNYILPLQQAELVTVDSDDVQIGEFWEFLKDYTEVQYWIRRELYNKRQQNVQLHRRSAMGVAVIDGLNGRNMVVAQKGDDDNVGDSESTKYQELSASNGIPFPPL
ncbi:hypothetical protein BESB_030290 [Besnoitia besnoiti]|uniref:Uncharacterized protein n=1 Tax=Besnoitia besnoiti TaxID=94643 RepID=A0A2A9LZG2_BESBE|nr:hypothetical protein BESB_030290 [Besnoitia besnoiti]PFH31155.1 hypothetical protein BESB_030290 [Besnoitia besnoiti]